MTQPRRAAVAVIATALVAQVGAASATVVRRRHHHRVDPDTLRVALQSTPAPAPTRTTRRRPPHHAPVVPTPAATLPTPTVTLPPLPVTLPTVTLPPVHAPKSPCDLAKAAVQPHATATWPVQSRNEDASRVIIDHGSAWFTETSRDGSYATSLVGIDLTTGKQWRSEPDAFLTLFDVTGSAAWGLDRDGVVEMSLATGRVVDRWSSTNFLTHGGAQLAPESVQVSSSGVYVMGSVGGSSTEGLSLLDPRSGAVRWTTVLPRSDGMPGLALEPGNGLSVLGSDAYVALVLRQHGVGVLRTWRVDADGSVVADRSIHVPNADPESEWRTAAGDGAFYVDVSIDGHFDGAIVRLDPADLQVTALTAAPVVEGFDVGPTGVWVVSLGCGPFVWFRYDGSLRPEGKPWRMPDDSYAVDAGGDTVWSLRTVSPARAVDVAGFTPG